MIIGLLAKRLYKKAFEKDAFLPSDLTRVTGTLVLIEESDFNYKYAVFKDEIGGYYYSDWNYKEDMDNIVDLKFNSSIYDPNKSYYCLVDKNCNLALFYMEIDD